MPFQPKDPEDLFTVKFTMTLTEEQNNCALRKAAEEKVPRNEVMRRALIAYCDLTKTSPNPPDKTI